MNRDLYQEKIYHPENFDGLEKILENSTCFEDFYKRADLTFDEAERIWADYIQDQEQKHGEERLQNLAKINPFL